MTVTDIALPEYYINRDLSLLSFHFRVLELAQDTTLPLFERLRFLLICSRNLDEFFEIRMAALKQQVDYHTPKLDNTKQAPEEIIEQSSIIAHQFSDALYDTLNHQILPALEAEDIRFLPQAQWNEAQALWIKRYFRAEVLPILTPIGLDLSHPFPRLVNKSLNFIVQLKGKDAFGRDSGLAIIHASRALDRIVRLPEKVAPQGDNFIFLSAIIHAHATELFSGMTVTGCYPFRLTRNSELLLNEAQGDSLLHAVKGKLLSRRYGDAVRIEISKDCPKDISSFLLSQFLIPDNALYPVAGPVNLNRLGAILEHIKRPALYYPPLTNSFSKQRAVGREIFSTLQQGDLLLHHPYQSFKTVELFICQAAQDPNVLAIKVTLYRVEPNSKMVDDLVDAAKLGKEVSTVIELRARFDEADNIALANRLQEAGALVVYGVVGYKTHAKMTLVVRKEGSHLRRYVHLGTGNYHTTNAELYCDFGLLTCDRTFTLDVHDIFQQLTGMGRATKLKKIIHAPFTLHKTLLHLIQAEIDYLRAGGEAHIILKLNALTETKVIQALYLASQAGVKIDLIVRGMCCLRPGIPNISETIKVRSIVGRFLEHARIYYFHHNGEKKLYLSSADWMDRNFFHRVEVCFPIEDDKLKERVKKEGLNLFLSDNTQSWQLQSDSSYKRNHPTANQNAKNAQTSLIDLLI